MGNMNIMGSYSGIGMDTVDQLIEAEKSKGVQFTNRKSKIEKQQSAWKDVSTRLDSLYINIEKLQNPETFQSQTVKSSIKESPFLSVTGNKDAAAGQYRMEVKQLATSSRLTGEQVMVNEDDIKSINEELEIVGDFSYTVGGKNNIVEGEEVPFSINIKASDSLKDIVDKINGTSKDSGVQASIVDNRLILTGTEMGAQKIIVEGDLAVDLGFTGEPLQLEEGQDAELIIDGLLIKKSSNQIDDVIEGLTINLTNTHETGKSELITIEQDSQKTVKAVKEFVDQYNSVMSFIDEQTDFGDPSLENNKAGALAGESSVTRLQSGLRSLLSRNVEGSADDKIKNLSDLGIEIDRYGKATLDEAKLSEVIQEDPANAAKFFYQPEIRETTVNGEIIPATPKRGMSELLKNFVDTYTSSSKGLIKTTKESNDRMLKDIEKQIETFNKRIDKKRDRYIREFTALDQAMMQAESQMDFLYSQLGMDNK